MFSNFTRTARQNFKPIKGGMMRYFISTENRISISFVCNKCNNKVEKTMSKQAYTKGVVLIQCPQCTNRHLIADNLNWFQTGSKNVEELVSKKEKSNDDTNSDKPKS